MTAFFSEQLELDFSGAGVGCNVPVRESPKPSPCNSCSHPRLYWGLDAAYCPDCRREFKSWTKEYKRTLIGEPEQPPPPASECEPSVGDLVTLIDSPANELCEILKIADGHATVERLGASGKSGNNRRRIALWKIRPYCAICPEQLPAVAECSGQPQPVVAECSGQPECFICPEQLPAVAECSGQPQSSLLPKHWVEVYSPSKRKQFQYFRYMWRDQGKLRHKHIPSGNVRSPRAQANLAAVELAIDAGRSPQEILTLIGQLRAGGAG